MLPLPTPRIFRSRYRALWWSFCVIVAAVLTVGFADPTPKGSGAAATDVVGQQVDDADLKALMGVLNAS